MYGIGQDPTPERLSAAEKNSAFVGASTRRQKSDFQGSQAPDPLILPYPVSANVYWRTAGGSTYVSAAARAYKARVALAVRQQLGVCRPGPARALAVDLVLLPRANKNGASSKVRLDLDNCIKVTLDALQGLLYTNDASIVRISASIGDPVAGGGLQVRVEAA